MLSIEFDDACRSIAFAKFFHSLNGICEKHPMLCQNKVALAVSGGADSMCLASMCQILFKHRFLACSPICLVVDHKLRPESTVEANFVRDYLISRGLECIIFTWKHEGHENIKSNPHHKARCARYNLLTRFCIDNNIQYMCTAHTYDDQSETVIMRIIRGSGINGIAAIREIHTMCGIKLLRPMLDISRDEVLQFLQLTSWKWVEDPSNHYKCYERTKVRELVRYVENSDITSGKLFKKRLVLLAKNARRVEEFLDGHVHELLQKVVYYSRFGYAIISLKSLSILDEEIFLRLIKSVLLHISCCDYDSNSIHDMHSIRLNNLLLLYKKLKNIGQICFKKCSLARCNIFVTKGYLFIHKERKFLTTLQITHTTDEIYHKSISHKLQHFCSTGGINNTQCTSEESHELHNILCKASYVGPCTIDGWKLIKKCMNSNINYKEQIVLDGHSCDIDIPYYTIMMSTYILYDTHGKPLYSFALSTTL